VDIVRPDVKRKKQIRRIIYIVGVLVVAVVITGFLSKLKPAAPGVDKATIYPDTVKRGPMLRDVRGLGTLVPETIHVISAPVDGTVSQRYMLPGTPVHPNTVILDMVNPQLQQLQLDAEYQLKGAQATYEQTKALLENQLMDKRTTAAGIRSQYQTADLQRQTQEQLYKNGLTPELQMKTAEVQAEELKKQDELAQKEVETFQGSIQSQLAVQEAAIQQKKALYDLYTTQMNELHIQPGIEGMFQELDVDVGQRVIQGAPLAKVTQPTQLKAQLKIAETQAKDVQLNQKAEIDTHNGIIPGHVIRIDPSVVNGTRTVDVKLDGPLPEGAVPDLSVEGTVELERLPDILFVGRPVHGDANSTVGLFKVVGPWSDAKEAVRVQVELGKTSVSYVQILKGLEVGDTVILSDMSAYDNFDRVELK